MVLATSARGLASSGVTPWSAAVADQVADVGHDPVGARLDELVVVELRQVLFQRADLLGQHGHQRLQRPALFGVAHAIDRGEEVEERFSVHHATAKSMSPAASVSSSAGEEVPPGLRRGGGQPHLQARAADQIQPVQRVDIHGDHTGNRLDGRHHLAQRHRLAERAGVEGEIAQKRRPDVRFDLVSSGSRGGASQPLPA